MKRIVIVCLLLALLIACQPTPQTEFVVNKGDGKMEEIIYGNTQPQTESDEVQLAHTPGSTQSGRAPEDAPQSAASEAATPQPPAFPSHWTDNLSTQYMNLTIDAEIDFNGLKTFPVYEIANTSFSDAKKQAIILALLPEPEAAHRGTEDSREEIEEKLRCAMRGAEKRLPNGTVEYVSWPEQEEYLAELKKQYQSAAPEAELYRPVEIAVLLESEATFTVRQKSGEKGWVSSHATKEIGTFLQVSNGGKGVSIQRQSWHIPEIWDEPDNPVIIHPTISEETALDFAAQFFETIGTAMPTLIFAEPARMFSSDTLGTVSEGYYLRFRQNAGYPVIYSSVYTQIGGCLSIDDAALYSCPWGMETIELYVDGSGVRSVNWLNPVEIGDCVNQNVPLLPFDELRPCIRNLLRASMRNIDSISATGYRMTDMKLTAYPIALRDDRGYVLAPVWYLSFEVYGLNPRSDEIKVDRLMTDLRMAILINAIDGSAILVPNGGLD